jgi:hypothetical protein
LLTNFFMQVLLRKELIRQFAGLLLLSCGRHVSDP